MNATTHQDAEQRRHDLVQIRAAIKELGLDQQAVNRLLIDVGEPLSFANLNAAGRTAVMKQLRKMQADSKAVVPLDGKRKSLDRRRRELAQIHIAKKDLRMEDDIYRQLLRDLTNVDSAADLDVRGRGKLLAHFKRLGWKPKPEKPQQKVTALQPQDRKIRALWLDLHKRGIVRDRSEAALSSYVKRQTGVDRLEWLDNRQATKVIEALKKWGDRVDQQTGDVQ